MGWKGLHEWSISRAAPRTLFPRLLSSQAAPRGGIKPYLFMPVIQALHQFSMIMVFDAAG